MTEHRSYPFHQSRLYKIKSPAQLADLLNVRLGLIDMLLSARENYVRFTEKKSGRPIQEPKPTLQAIHKRVAKLLGRIETPDELHSAKKGRSYVTMPVRTMAPPVRSKSTSVVSTRRFALARYIIFSRTRCCAAATLRRSSRNS